MTSVLHLDRLGRASETNMAILKFSVHITINPVTWHISQFLKLNCPSENCINQQWSPLVLVRGISKLSWTGHSCSVFVFLFTSFLMSKIIYSPTTCTVKLMSKCCCCRLSASFEILASFTHEAELWERSKFPVIQVYTSASKEIKKPGENCNTYFCPHQVLLALW